MGGGRWRLSLTSAVVPRSAGSIFLFLAPYPCEEMVGDRGFPCRQLLSYKQSSLVSTCLFVVPMLAFVSRYGL